MTPKEALVFAESLIDDPGASEAACRGAAEWAYYAVYHLVCDHFRVDPAKNYDQAKHDAIRLRLRSLDVATSSPELRAARTVFERLWRLRVRAHYHIDDVFSGDDAEDAVEHAKGVFVRIQPAVSPPEISIEMPTESAEQEVISCPPSATERPARP